MSSQTDCTRLQEQVRELEAQVATLQTRCDELLKEKNDIFYKWTKKDFTTILTERYADVSLELQENIWNDTWTREFEKRFPFHVCYESMLEIMDDVFAEYGITPRWD